MSRKTRMALIALKCLLLISPNCFSQVFGVIVDSNGSTISYCTIKVANKSMGYVSDRYGKFQIDHIKSGDSLIFSALGYADKTIQYNIAWKPNDSIVLEQEVYVFPEFTFTDKSPQVFESSSKKSSGLVNPLQGVQILSKVNLPQSECAIDQIEIKVSSPQFESKSVVLLVFDKTTEGKPGQYLLKSPTISPSLQKGKWLVFNNLNLSVKESEFFIGLFWVKNPDNLQKQSIPYTKRKDQHSLFIRNLELLYYDWVDMNINHQYSYSLIYRIHYR